MKKYIILVVVMSGWMLANAQLTLVFKKGRAHNHPLFAVWLADEEGRFLETLFVSESIGKGVFDRVDKSSGKWEAGEIQRPAALPYWAHQRGVRNAAGTFLPTPQQPDAMSGPTPVGSFRWILSPQKPLPKRFQILVEINQSWDWNAYWHNAKYPDDVDYKTSCQPAIVYQVVVDRDAPPQNYSFQAIGHSHYNGYDGSLTRDLSTLTTALKIARYLRLEKK